MGDAREMARTVEYVYQDQDGHAPIQLAQKTIFEAFSCFWPAKRDIGVCRGQRRAFIVMVSTTLALIQHG